MIIIVWENLEPQRSAGFFFKKKLISINSIKNGQEEYLVDDCVCRTQASGSNVGPHKERNTIGDNIISCDGIGDLFRAI